MQMIRKSKSLVAVRERERESHTLTKKINNINLTRLNL